MSYKPDSFELSITEIPIVSPKVYDLLDDFIEECEQGFVFDEAKNDTLEQICIALEDLDRNIGSYLQSFQEKGILSSDEILILNTYFLVSKQKNSDTNSATQVMRDMMYQGVISYAQFSEKVDESDASTYMKYILKKAYKSITTK